MTAQLNTLSTSLSELTKDNPYNLYNLEAKTSFSQISTSAFSQHVFALLKGAAHSENGNERLALTGIAVKGGENA